MSYYFIANITIHNQEEYQRYVNGTDDVFKKYNGKYLAVDNAPKTIEGEWNYQRAVIIEFQTKEDFKAWYYSKDYQEILKFRLAAAKCDTILVQGLQ